MKHIKFKYGISLLPVFFLIFIFAGCGGTYNAEKMYWQVNKKYSTVYKDPTKASDEDFKKAVEAFKSVISKHQAWSKSADLQFYLGQMYLVRKDYGAAREEFKKVYMNFPEKYELCARALFAEGSTYEQQGNWKNAVDSYNELVTRYQTTVTGMQVPLYIAKHYQDKNLKAEAEKAYSSAVNNYFNLIETNPYGKSVPLLQHLMMIGYGNQNKWGEAISVFKRFVKKYPESEFAPTALYKIAVIYRDMLKDMDKAVSIYRKIITDYPDCKISKDVSMDLGGLSIIEGNVDQSKEEFSGVQKKYPDDLSLCAAAQLGIAVVYEKAGRWDEALREYKKLQENYPYTLEAMQAPLKIAMYYNQEKNEQEVESVLNEAAANYQVLIDKKPGKKIEAALYDHLANVLAIQKKWDKALNIFTLLRQKYPEDPRSVIAMLRIGLIYQEGLKDKENARSVYARFIQEYPEHNLAKIANELLNKIK